MGWRDSPLYFSAKRHNGENALPPPCFFMLAHLTGTLSILFSFSLTAYAHVGEQLLAPLLPNEHKIDAKIHQMLLSLGGDRVLRYANHLGTSPQPTVRWPVYLLRQRAGLAQGHRLAQHACFLAHLFREVASAASDLRGAIAFIRARPIPITQLILIGASLGALEEVKEAATTPCDGLVVISAPLGYQDVQISDADLARLRMPKLFVTSADNQPFASDTLHMFEVSPLPKDKRVYSGDAHGVRLFAGTSGPALLSSILEFVQRTAPAH
jgi:hypothetical protein